MARLDHAGTPILCGVDRSDGAAAVVEVAAALARGLRSRLILLHAASSPSLDIQTRQTVLGAEAAIAEHRRGAEAWLAGLAADIDPGGADVRVELGPPGDWLAGTAERESAMLVVVGRRARADWRSIGVGRVSDELVRRSPCPVVVVPPPAREAPAPWHAGGAIVCGIGSADDGAVARLGAGLAAGLGGGLALAHVRPVRDGGPTGPAAAGRGEGAGRRLLREVARGLAVAVPASGNLPETRLLVRRGDPGAELAAQAAEDRAALLVVGSRGRGPLRSRLLGSTSRRLAGEAGVPVVICPPGVPVVEPVGPAPAAGERVDGPARGATAR